MKKILLLTFIGTLFASVSAFGHCGSCGVGEAAHDGDKAACVEGCKKACCDKEAKAECAEKCEKACCKKEEEKAAETAAAAGDACCASKAAKAA